MRNNSSSVANNRYSFGEVKDSTQFWADVFKANFGLVMDIIVAKC